MKKIICVILATLMLFALVGCGGSATTAETSPIPSNTAKTATFEINNVELREDGTPTYIYVGMYCESLDKTLLIEGRLRDKIYEELYCKFSEGDIVKVIWEENKTGEIIESSLIFEKVSNELVPIKDVGGG